MTDPESQPTHHGAAERRHAVRRWIPGGAAVILVIILALVAVFILVRPGWFETPFQEGPPPELAYIKSLADLGERDGIRLSDDGTLAKAVTAPLPVDSRVDHAHLLLAGRAQVAEASTVFLRVLADGESVYVDELKPGNHDVKAEILLPPGVLDDGSVTVQMRLTGALDEGTCNPTNELGSFVLLDPAETRIEATLYNPVYSVRDAVGALNRDVTLEVAAPKEDRAWFETAARMGVALTQRGYRVSYHAVADSPPGNWRSRILLGPVDRLTELGWTAPEDAGPRTWQVGRIDDTAVLALTDPAAQAAAPFLLTDAVTTADSAANESRVDSPEEPVGDAVSLAPLGMDTAVQRIGDRRVWRTPYWLTELPGGRVPREVRLQLRLPLIGEEARWMVQIQLNGQLLDSVQLAGGSATQDVTVPIPEGIEALRNDLAVTLLRDRDLVGCTTRSPSYDVQLLPTSSLVLGGPGAGLTAVPADFAAGFDILLPSSSTDDPATSLAALVPTLAHFRGWLQPMSFVWDGLPSDRPFFLFGNPPSGVDVPVRLVDGRLVAAGFDLQAFQNGLVVERASAGAARGLVVIAMGRPPDNPVPYGREAARLVTGVDGGVVVSDPGGILTPAPTERFP